MSLLWTNRAQLVTPWNPWIDSSLFVRHEFGAPNVRLYDATHLDRVYAIGSADPNQHQIQNVAASMGAYLASDPDYRGHGSVTFAAGTGQRMASGTWATPVPTTCTWYVVAKNTAIAGLRVLFCGGGSSYGLQGNAGKLIMQTITAQSSTADFPGVVIASCMFGATSKLFVNSATAEFSTATLATMAPPSLFLGNYAGSPVLAWGGSMAMIAGFAGHPDTPLHTRRLRWFADKYGGTIA